MNIKVIYINKDYYVFLMKDIISRFKTFNDTRNKNKTLLSWVSIPNTEITLNREVISLAYTDDKVTLKSNVFPSANLISSDTKYVFFNKGDKVIGFEPEIEDVKTRVNLIASIYENYKNDNFNLNVWGFTNWEIVFSLQSFDKAVKVTMNYFNLKNELNISLDSIKTFIHESIYKHIEEWFGLKTIRLLYILMEH